MARFDRSPAAAALLDLAIRARSDVTWRQGEKTRALTRWRQAYDVDFFSGLTRDRYAVLAWQNGAGWLAVDVYQRTRRQAVAVARGERRTARAKALAALKAAARIRELEERLAVDLESMRIRRWALAR